VILSINYFDIGLNVGLLNITHKEAANQFVAFTRNFELIYALDIKIELNA